jgi:hypothetical protein
MPSIESYNPGVRREWPQRASPLSTESQRTAPPVREYVIRGITANGQRFRPSDWADRLCGVMSGYRPGGVASDRDAAIGYSPYCQPTTVDGIKCVIVDARLRELERMAFDFVMNFARDNGLQVVESGLPPEKPQK